MCTFFLPCMSISTSPDPTLIGMVTDCILEGQMLSASAFQIENSSHPQLMNILSLNDKLSIENVCHVVI